MTILGFGLINCRAQRGMTLRDLGKKAGVSAAFLSDVEHGRRSMKPETLERVASVLEAKVVEVDAVCQGCSGTGKMKVPAITWVGIR